MWLDQLERDAVQAQETEGNLAQQYQVGLCVSVCVLSVYLSRWTCTLDWALHTQTLPIISLISGFTLWGLDGSRSYFLVYLAYSTSG